MFEGLIQLQLPFILISSGISSGLYLLFLFFNIGQPTDQINSNTDQKSFTIEISPDTQDQNTLLTLHDYYSQSFINVAQTNIKPKLQTNENRPIKCRSFKRAYSFHFAQASYSRPPPSC